MDDSFTHTLKTGAFVYILCFLLFADGGCNQHKISVSHPVSLSIARSGVNIIGTVNPIGYSDVPPNATLKCTTASGIRSLSSLGNQKGLVHVESPSDALLFVRFRTSLYTYEYFPDSWMVEIFSHSELNQMPNYGLPPDFEVGYAPGVLDDREFTRMGFFEASVKQIAGRFAITRWLLVYELGTGKEYVEKVCESVGQDGDYNIVVLKRKPISYYNKPQSKPYASWWYERPDYR